MNHPSTSGRLVGSAYHRQSEGWCPSTHSKSVWPAQEVLGMLHPAEKLCPVELPTMAAGPEESAEVLDWPFSQTIWTRCHSAWTHTGTKPPLLARWLKRELKGINWKPLENLLITKTVVYPLEFGRSVTMWDHVFHGTGRVINSTAGNSQGTLVTIQLEQDRTACSTSALRFSHQYIRANCCESSGMPWSTISHGYGLGQVWKLYLQGTCWE